MYICIDVLLYVCMYVLYTYVLLFQYLGCVEVFESRGMQVCEDALKILRVMFHTFLLPLYE